MARGKHVPKRHVRGVVLVATIAFALVLVLGGAAISAYRYEQARAGTILPGVTIDGLDVGGMTRPEAVAAVRRHAATRLEAPITISVRGETRKVTPAELGRRAHAVAAVNRALGVSDSMDTLARFWHRFRSDPVDRGIRLAYAGDGRVDAFLGKVAKDVAVAPVDAAIILRGGSVAFVKPKPGRALDFAGAGDDLREALELGTTTRVRLEMLKVAPKVTPENMGRTIVVRVDRNRLYLYEGFEVIRTFGVATAKPGWTTPAGDWEITRKAVNPTWYNPALDSWGASLPAVVPGGPDAPMGTRAIYIDEAPGLIRIHGTPSDPSIGRYASHGCIRMHNSEIEQLYPMIPVGARVIIAGKRPGSAQEWDTPRRADI